MEDKRVLLVTSTVSGEGVSTIATNLAEALKDRGHTVALVDGHDPAAIGGVGAEEDMVIVDAPACQRMDQLAAVAEQADAVLYVIRQDQVSLPQIMSVFEDLEHFDAAPIGCVLSGVQIGIAGYGYGYGYGYGKSKKSKTNK